MITPDLHKIWLEVSGQVSQADKLFEDLGYEKIKQDVIYEGFWEEYYNADRDKTISFNLTGQIVYITDNEEWGITMQELKAINKKCEELKWI